MTTSMYDFGVPAIVKRILAAEFPASPPVEEARLIVAKRLFYLDSIGDEQRWDSLSQSQWDQYLEEADVLLKEIDFDLLPAAQRFKSYVHKRLDDAGVPVDPDSPHKAEGCRIGGRLDWVLGELAAARARAERMEMALRMVRDELISHMWGAWPGTMAVTAQRVQEEISSALAATGKDGGR